MLFVIGYSFQPFINSVILSLQPIVITRMKQFFTLLILGFVSLSFGQTNWIKGNAVWHYSFNNISSGWIKLWTSGDTVIQTKTCTILKSIKHEFIITGPSGNQVESETAYINGYVYYENDTVFYWNSDHFSVLYDFNAVAGEEWVLSDVNNTGLQCDDSSIIQVESVSQIAIGGDLYNELTVSPTTGSSIFVGSRVNTRFGSSSSYLLPFGRNCDSTVIVEFDQIQFTCFQDDSLYYNPSGSSCEYYLAIEESGKSSLIVFPNPAQEKVEILSDVAVKKIKVYDVFGKLIEEINTLSTMQKIDVSAYEAGTYFIQIETLGGEKVVRSIQISGK